MKGDIKLTLQFGIIRRSCRSGLTHRRKGHGALLLESWMLWPLPCEDKHGRQVTSGNAVIGTLTLAFAVVVCRLVLPGCRAFAACSPPAVGLSCSS
jgi:hypothetical protein